MVTMSADLSLLLEEYYKEAEKIKENFKLYDSMLENNTTIGEYTNMMMDKLQKLIEELKRNEEEFYKEVLNSDNPNFLITAYYSLYLRFVTTVYLLSLIHI